VAEFDEEVHPDAYGRPVISLVPMFTLVFGANLNNLGLENGCLVHGEVSWTGLVCVVPLTVVVEVGAREALIGLKQS
jgi:hypothetical protein